MQLGDLVAVLSGRVLAATQSRSYLIRLPCLLFYTFFDLSHSVRPSQMRFVDF